MRVRFTEPFDYVPTEDPRILVAFSPKGGAGKDGVYTVRRECGEAAIAAGKAEEIGADPLDHDLDGRKGGSLPKAKKADAETLLVQIDEDSKVFAASMKRIKATDARMVETRRLSADEIAQPTPKILDAEA